LTPLGESAEGARPPSTDRKRERERLPGLSGFEALFMNDGSDDERRRAVDILVCRAAAAATEGRNGGRVNYYARRPTAERLNWIRPNCLDPPPTAAANAGVHEPTSTTGLRYENVPPTMIYERRRTTRMQKD